MKRFLAMVLALCMLFSMQTVFASAEGTEKDAEPNETRTMEEILNEYHQKAAEAQLSAEKNTGASIRSAASGKTLEQETVDTLTAAGYEAYNVTGDNYDDLEETLKTDFSSMGLSPEGSYVIVISGDEEETQTNSNSRHGGNLIEQVDGSGGGGDGFTVFTHTYNGESYLMRYVTITGGENTQLLESSDVDVLDECNVTHIQDVLDGVMSIVSSLGAFPLTSAFYSLYSALMPDVGAVQTESLVYIGSTNWTITYIQVYDTLEQKWKYSACTEYVTMHYTWTHVYYEPKETGNEYGSKYEDGRYGTIYSANYNNKAYMKDKAAFAFNYNSAWFDTIDEVNYEFMDRTIITHQRWMEPLHYEPA